MAYTTIDKSDDYFNTVLYTGTSAENAITGVNFQSDFTWIKGRSISYDHRLVDSVRGATKELYSDLTNAEATDAQGLKSFNSDGFTLGTANAVNNSGATFVAWNWLAGGTGVSNTQGTITSTVSANTTAGFSIVSYTGNSSVASFGHGLGVAPKMIIIKNRSISGSGSNWCVGVDIPGWTWNTDYLYLNTDGAKATDGGGTQFWSAPTSTVVNIGGGTNTNNSGNSMIAYCFAEKKGFSKFGIYTGNGSSNGTFVYLGFKPAWIMIKRTDVARDWLIHDNKRLGYNDKNYYFQANLSDTEGTATPRIDLLSNGWKYRTSNIAYNASGGTYTYAAFAENPLVTSTGIPACAR